MQAKPTLAEWRADNPGKSLNDYYAEHGHVPQSPAPIPHQNYQYPPMPQQVVYVERESQPGVNMLGVLASGVALVAYFLPWVKALRLSGLVQPKSYSPRDFSRFISDLAALQNMKLNETERFWLTTPWLLVVLPLVALVCALLGATAIRAITAYLYVMFAAYWLYQTWAVSAVFSQEVPGMIVRINLEPGYYLAAVASMLMLADAIQASTSKK